MTDVTGRTDEMRVSVDDGGYGFRQVPDWVLFHPDLSDRAKIAYGALLFYAGMPKGCIAGQEALAAKLGKSVRTLQRAIDELVDVGAVTVHRADRNTTNRHVVHRWPAEVRAARHDNSVASRHDNSVASRHDNSVVQSNSEVSDSEGDSPTGTRALAEASGSPDPAEEFSEEVVNLTRMFARLVRENGHAWPSTTKGKRGWYVEMDRLLRLGPPGDTPGDPPTSDDIEFVMRWALVDSSFWPANIRSVGKFREKFTVLAGQMVRDTGGGQDQPTGLDAVARFLKRIEGDQ